MAEMCHWKRGSNRLETMETMVLTLIEAARPGALPPLSHVLPLQSLHPTKGGPEDSRLYHCTVVVLDTRFSGCLSICLFVTLKLPPLNYEKGCTGDFWSGYFCVVFCLEYNNVIKYPLIKLKKMCTHCSMTYMYA